MARQTAKVSLVMPPGDTPAAQLDMREPVRAHFAIAGMDCADCAHNIERQVARVPGVRASSVNFLSTRLSVEADLPEPELSQVIRRVVREAGYQATPIADASQPRSGERMAERASLWKHPAAWPALAAAVLWAFACVAGLVGAPGLLVDGFYAASVATGGYRVARNGYYSLVRGRTLGIDLLMTIAVVGAALIGEWAEAAAVVVLFALGALLEGLTMDKARNAIRSLMDLSPRTAYVRTEEGEQEVPVEKLVPGDIVMVRPGDLVAADGQVVAGRTTIDQASITGESVPVEKQVDDEVFAGTANQRGYIEVVVTRRAEDTTLARIISLVEEAQARRAPAQRFVDRFASRYTPAVLLLAILIAAVPPLLGAAFLPWVYKALVLLVIACPCALVISTPVSIVAGIARASRSGVLIKGGAFLEAMASTRVIAFDKTGTLTQGKPVVTDILPCAGQDEATVLAIAAAVESRSEHPLAGAILCAARERDLSWPEVEHFEALPGCGAHAMLGDEPVQIGNERLFPNATPDVRGRIAAWQDVGKTVLLVGRSGHLIGLIAVTDTLRPRAEEAIHELRAAGVHTIVMLTGDGERTADVVARRLGLDDRRAGLLPEQKTLVVQELLRKHGQVAMVGDGVNDAPALATASVGIAMGAAGSDTALETADVALMGDDLRHLPYLINLSRATLRTIRANIAFSIVVKIIFLALTLLGFASLWLAILADTGAALLVIANGMRLLRFQAGRQ